ncbi:hypothetical protein Trydic_g22906 [Trypoxylus dichotomus]
MSGIASACDASMPRKAPRHCKRAAYWWTAEIAELRRRCLRLRRIAQRAGNREEANIRSAEHREAKESPRRAINEARHWKDMVSDVDSDPWGLGYKLVTRRLGAMKPPAILELTRMQRIVRALFSSHPARVDRGLRMLGDFLLFNEEELRTVMGSLAQRRTPGPDNITNEILKLVYQHTPHLLLDMYNECLAAEVFPTRWKVARLVLPTTCRWSFHNAATKRIFIIWNNREEQRSRRHKEAFGGDFVNTIYLVWNKTPQDCTKFGSPSTDFGRATLDPLARNHFPECMMLDYSPMEALITHALVSLVTTGL